MVTRNTIIENLLLLRANFKGKIYIAMGVCPQDELADALLP